ADHLIDATQNTDAYTAISSALKIHMMNMSKISNDLRMMASGPRTGLAEINLPARQPGTSIMPGKINPVICEVVNQVAVQGARNAPARCLASAARYFKLSVMEPVLIYNLHLSLTCVQRVLDTLNDYRLKGIAANIDVCKAFVENSIGVITALNP